MDRTAVERLLRQLPLEGGNLLAHVVPAACGIAAADAADLCLALRDCLGAGGTLVMPAFTDEQTLVTRSPSPRAFHSDLAVDTRLGDAAEAFRRLPGVLRSSHPSHSFCASGRAAHAVLSTNRDNNPLGPIKKLNLMGGIALLLGASLELCSSFHLAEENMPPAYLGRAAAKRVNVTGYEERVVIDRVPGCARAFSRLEAAVDSAVIARQPFFQSIALVVPIRSLIRIASAALAADPEALVCDDAACASCAAKRAALHADRGS
jgi:aminoglycoside N3'-acetyltransferase